MAIATITQTLQDAATAIGNGTTVYVQDKQTAVLQVSGTFSATVTFEATQDGTNWVTIRGEKLDDGTAVTTATAAGLFRFDVRGLQYIRARISAYTSGSVTVTGTVTPL